MAENLENSQNWPAVSGYGQDGADVNNGCSGTACRDAAYPSQNQPYLACSLIWRRTCKMGRKHFSAFMEELGGGSRANSASGSALCRSPVEKITRIRAGSRDHPFHRNWREYRHLQQ